MAYKPPYTPKPPAVGSMKASSVNVGLLGSKRRKRSPYLKAIEQFSRKHPKGGA